MKAPSISIILLLFGASLLSTSCKKDDPAPAAATTTLSLAALEGDWIINSGEGTEWKEGVGIITPKATDNSAVGFKFRFEDNFLTVYDASGAVLAPAFNFTLNATTGVIDAGPGSTGLGVYTIKNFGAKSMEWDQREPIAADYEDQAGCGCKLAFQKFWKFARM